MMFLCSQKILLLMFPLKLSCSCWYSLYTVHLPAKKSKLQKATFSGTPCRYWRKRKTLQGLTNYSASVLDTNNNATNSRSWASKYFPTKYVKYFQQERGRLCSGLLPWFLCKIERRSCWEERLRELSSLIHTF